MPMWRCPHCGTPQAETARCWVCRRSSTSCGTCRHYRRSVAGQLGYCGLDRRRQPLTGEEIRSCWDARPSTLGDGTPVPLTIAAAGSAQDDARRPIDFVEVGILPAADGDEVLGDEALASPTTHPAEPGWSLWGDSEI
jgi:hypothetical protein